MQPKPKFTIWDDLSIPAKLFYRIVEEKNHSLLVISGNPNEKQIEDAWFRLIDKVCEVRDDQKRKTAQKQELNIVILSLKINYITNILRILSFAYLTKEQRMRLIIILGKRGIKIDPEKDNLDEVKRVLDKDLSALQTRLKIEQDRLADMTKPTAKKTTFERVCVELSRSFQFFVGTGMTLGEFLAMEQSVIEMTEKSK